MKPERQAYIKISGELILRLLKEKFKLWDDTELVSVIFPHYTDPIDLENTIRIVVTSENLPLVYEGNRLHNIQLEERKP